MSRQPFHFDHVSLSYINGFLDLTSPSERKSLVMLARAQQPPRIVSSDDTDALSLFGQQPIQSLIYRSSRALAHNDSDYLLHEVSLFFSPALSGYVINYLYQLPIQDDIIESTKSASFQSEFDVTQQERREPIINWRPFFDKRSSFEPLNPIIPVNAELSKAIQEHMTAFKSSYRFRTLYPESSKRGVSHSTQREFLKIMEGYQLNLPPYSDITPTQLLQLYLQTEETTPGCSEMRQVWYPTGLKPRTYFAQGGDAYFASLYLKTFFNSLADTFKFTNRFQRVQPDRLKLVDRTGRFIIYDYSNFTSNFSEQFHFLQELSSFFSDCHVTILGPKLSRTIVSISSLIDEYIRVCNDHPKFEFGTGIMYDCSGELYHIQAGFLGVFGNLMTCTIPHGLVARTIATSDDSVCVAGDDGNLEPNIPESLAFKVLMLLGVLSIMKCFLSNFMSVFLKLPFQTIDGEVVVGGRLEFPNLNFAHFGEMDPRFTRLKDTTSGDRRLLIYRQIVRFVRSLCVFRYEIQDYELGIIASILNGLISRMGLTDEGRGDNLVNFNTRYKGRQSFKSLRHILWSDLTNMEYTRTYPRTDHNECIRIRRRGQSTYSLGLPLEEGDIHFVTGGRAWKYLENSGYIRVCPVLIDMEEDSEFVFVCAKDLDDYREVGPELRRIEVLKDVTAFEMSVLHERPEAAYIDAIEIIQGLDSSRNRKRLKSAFSDSRYIDLDDPNGIDVKLLDYGDEFGNSDSYYSTGLVRTEVSLYL